MALYVYAGLNGDNKYLGSTDIVFNGTWSSSHVYIPPMDAVVYGSSQYIVLIQNSGSAPVSSKSWAELVLLRPDVSPPGPDPLPIAEQALELANEAFTLACIGTNVGTNAFNLATQALSQSAAGAYNLAAIGTNVGTNALNLAQSALDGLNGVTVMAAAGTNLAQEALGIAIAGTNLAAAAYALAQIGTNTSAISAYNLAAIGTNVGTNALSAAAAAQATGNSALSGVNSVYVIATAGTNLAQEALSIASVGTISAAAAQFTANSAKSGVDSVYVIAMAGTNLAIEALNIAISGTNRAQAAYSLASIGTNVGTNALTNAATALSTANSAIAGINGVTVIASAGTNLAQSAYNLASIGTNVGSNAYALASTVASGVSAGAAYALASIGTNVGTNALTIAMAGSSLGWYGSNEYQIISTTGTDPNALGLQPFDIAKAALFITEPSINSVNNYRWSTVNRTWVPFQTKLTSNFTFFVRTDGNDSNTGLLNTAAGAWATIQHAVDYIVQTVVIPTAFTVTVQLADGTYAENVNLQTITGGGNVIINGNSVTPSNVSIAPSAGDAITAAKPSTGWQIQNLKLSAANGNSIATSFGGVVIVGPGLVFAAAKSGGFHMIANNNSAILLSAAAYSITGGTGNHYYATRGSVINSSVSPAVTITGSPTFTAFAAADDTGTVAVFGATFSGAVTGKRFDANLNGVIHTLSGASATYFPGTVVGTTANGGQYQ